MKVKQKFTGEPCALAVARQVNGRSDQGIAPYALCGSVPLRRGDPCGRPPLPNPSGRWFRAARSPELEGASLSPPLGSSRAWNAAAELGTSQQSLERHSRAWNVTRFSRVGMFLARRDVLDDPHSAQRCHPEEAQPTKDLVPAFLGALSEGAVMRESSPRIKDTPKACSRGAALWIPLCRVRQDKSYVPLSCWAPVRSS